MKGVYNKQNISQIFYWLIFIWGLRNKILM